MSSADNCYKQSGIIQVVSGSKLFDTRLTVFLKEFLEKDDFERNRQTTKKHEKLPSRQSLKVKVHVSNTSEEPEDHH